MKALSLFSGIGGIDLAGEWAGIETVAFCEREPFCQKVLKKHWPHIPIYDDVCTLTKERLIEDGIIGPGRTIDLIHGGYPCQPFSHAGKRQGERDDRHLWPEVFRLIQDIKPRWFVGENVAGHVTLGLDIVLSNLEHIGYAWEAFVIPACAVYALHRRDRVFIVAYPKSFDTWGLSIREKAKHAGFTFGSQNVADTEGERRRKTREHQSIRSEEWTSSSSENASDATSKGLWIESCEETGARMESEFERNSEDVAHTSGGRYRTQDRQIRTGWDSIKYGGIWAAEPDVGRVANGVPNRVDRLKALGNAVVPQQIYPILAAIKQIDDMICGKTATESTEPHSETGAE